MWQLIAFDKETQMFVEDYLLPDLSTDVVKRILDVEDEDSDLPVSVRQSEVPFAKVTEFASYIKVPFQANQNFEYEIGPISD